MRSLIVFGTAVCLAASAQAQMPTLTMESASIGGATDMSSKHLAEVAAKRKIATIQAQAGKILSKSILQVAQGKTDLSANPFILQFLMSKGLGPYSGLGRKKGKELAGNLRILYPYHLAHYYLIAFQATGIDSWDKLKGKTIFNGPPRGGALTTARAIIRDHGRRGQRLCRQADRRGRADSAVPRRRRSTARVRPTNRPPTCRSTSRPGRSTIVSTQGQDADRAFKSSSRRPATWRTFPVKNLAHYGPGVNVISEDDMFRTVSNTGGDVVNKSMPKALAKALTKAFIETLPDLYRKAPFARGQLFGIVDDTQMGMLMPCEISRRTEPGRKPATDRRLRHSRNKYGHTPAARRVPNSFLSTEFLFECAANGFDSETETVPSPKGGGFGQCLFRRGIL